MLQWKRHVPMSMITYTLSAQSTDKNCKICFLVIFFWHYNTAHMKLNFEQISSEHNRSNYAKLSSIEEIFEKQVRFSQLSSIEWSRYSWLSSDHIYILEYQEDFPRYASTTFEYYRCILHISFKSSISVSL